MIVQVQSQKVMTLSTEILVLGFFNEMLPPRGLAGELDWLLNNALSLLLMEGKISGHFGEGVLVSSGKTKTSKIYWVGLGEREQYNHALITKFAPDLYQRLQRLGVREAYLDLWDIEGCSIDYYSALNAFLKGVFQDPGEKNISLTFHTRDTERVNETNRLLKEVNFKSGGALREKGAPGSGGKA